MKLEAATCAILSLDGTLVYVESLQPAFAGVIALPEQPSERADEQVFTPGRVGTKKISPMSAADKLVPITELSERNQVFIQNYEQLRGQHGANAISLDGLTLYVAPEIPPSLPKKPKFTPEEKAARKKPKGGPKYLQKCTTCGQQHGHPNHPNDHAFALPIIPVATCAACDKPERDPVHGESNFGNPVVHRFVAVAGKPARVSKSSVEKSARMPRTVKTGLPAGPFKWTGTDDQLLILSAGNPKYQPKNSGRAIIEQIKVLGTATPDSVGAALAISGKWPNVTSSRLQLAFSQLLAAKLIEVA